MAGYKTLILEGRRIRGIIGIGDALKVIEQVFRDLGDGKCQMPAKLYIRLDKYKGDFRAMPAYIDGLKGCGIKWVNVHPENNSKGLPTVMAVIILSDASTGFPLCVMDGTYVTGLRTAAAAGVAAKYLARKDSRKVSLVGCGAQAAAQILALNELFNIKEVSVCARRYPEALKFIKRLMPCLKGVKMQAARTPKECVRNSDIIVTATPSRRPLVKLKWLKDGAHINAIGADARGKQELDPAILKAAKVVVDSWEQASHSGEINVPLAKGIISREDIYADIGEVVSGRKRGRVNEREITVFDSTGLAIQDIAMADFIYQKRHKLKKLKYISFV